MHSKAAKNEINSLSHIYNSRFYHEKQRDLAQNAYCNDIPAAYTNFNFKNTSMTDYLMKTEKPGTTEYTPCKWD